MRTLTIPPLSVASEKAPPKRDCLLPVPPGVRKAKHRVEDFMSPFKPKVRQQSMTKAELRAQGVQALAETSKPVTKLPMKIKRQCGRCDRFNSVLVEPGEAVPPFECSSCGYQKARP